MINVDPVYSLKLSILHFKYSIKKMYQNPKKTIRKPSDNKHRLFEILSQIKESISKVLFYLDRGDLIMLMRWVQNTMNKIKLY